MKERSLVAFTLLAQMAVGALWVLGALHLWATGESGAVAAGALTDKMILMVVSLMALGLSASFFHLGTPLNAWRVFANLRSSWLSREILSAILFTGASALLAGMQWLDLGSFAVRDTVAWSAALLGLALLYSMSNAYRLRTVPAWDTWVTLVSFFTTALLLGGLVVGAALTINSDGSSDLPHSARAYIALGAIVLLGVKLALVLLWIVRLGRQGGAAARAAAKVVREHAWVFRLQLALAVVSLGVAGLVLSFWEKGAESAMTLVFGAALVSEILGRLLFYEARVRLGV